MAADDATPSPSGEPGTGAGPTQVAAPAPAAAISESSAAPAAAAPVAPADDHADLARDLGAHRAIADGAADKSTHRYFHSPDTSAWHGLATVEHPSGRVGSWPSDQLAVWRGQVNRCTAVVVAGDVDLETQWVAEHLAQSGDPGDVRRGSHHDLTNYRFAQVLRMIGQAPARRLVVDYWPPYAATELAATIGNLSNAVEQHVGNPCQLIFWTRETGLHALIHAGQWPENVKLIVVDSNPRPHASRGDDATDDASFFRRLFGAEVAGLGDLLRRDEQLVEQTLARVIVLFGPLPSSDVDALMTGALAGRTISIPVEGSDPRIVQAGDLWTAGKDLFLRNGRLTRQDGGQEQLIAFATAATAEAAAAVAWADTESMIGLFSTTNASTLLFDVDAERTGRDLYEGCISAAVALARRAPRAFARRWLGFLQAGFAAWLRSTTPPASPTQLEALEVTLHRVCDGRAFGGGNRPARHFARRAGYLCRYLLVDSSELVEDLLEVLMRQTLHDLVWQLIVELRPRPYPRYHHWLKRLVAESPHHTELVDIVAREAFHNPELGLETICELAQWVVDPSDPDEGPLAASARLAPFSLLDEAYQRHGSDRDGPRSIGELLRAPLDAASGRCVDSYVEDCLVAESLNADDGTRARAYRVAVALFQGMVAATDAERDLVTGLAARTKRRLSPTFRRAVLDHLRRISAWYLAVKEKLKFNERSRADRQLLMERSVLCKRLIQA